jgi:LPPG:FO 2-phospho-L-lactate transferase
MTGPVVALCGGIGGAKLALGLSRVLEPRQLTIIVNTGDDFEHLGLSISPDIDTVLYTLGGVADRDRGWGRMDETWHFMEALRELGGEYWFQLGDRDLAMHIERTAFLRGGGTLSAFITRAARALGIGARVLPMTDDRIRTVVDTDGGTLPFQRYFVERRCTPVVQALRFEGAQEAAPAAGVVSALSDLAARAVVICPSNPYLSIDPILAVPGIREALENTPAPVIAVSPIIAGQAIKGPTVKIMSELGIEATTKSIAAHYEGFIDGLVIDDVDAADAASVGVPVLVTRTLMQDFVDRDRLAVDVVSFAAALASRKSAHAAGATM